MRATISILGLHNYTEGAIWDQLVLPADIDRDVVIGNILLECAELELIYPEPDTMTTAIGLWSKAEREVWEKLQATTKFVYNPIWNKDGVVTETETTHRLHKELGNEDEKVTAESSDTTGVHNTGTDTTQVAAYDSSAFQNREQNSTAGDSTSHTVNDSTGKTERDVDRDNMDADDRMYKRVEQGNIGVTTTQQMIREEREVDTFHIDDYIVQSFKRRFCLLVY